MALLILSDNLTSTLNNWKGPLDFLFTLRAFAAVQLNSYIAILATPKHKKESCSSGGKAKNFSFSTTVYI